MSDFFEHQKRIAIVGTSSDASSFITHANNLGFYTYQLCQENNKSEASRDADKILVGSINEEHIHEELIMECDLLVYFDYSMSPDQLETANKSIVIPQGEDLLAFARDRVLQKAFKESIGVNIAPFETIVKVEDIKNAMSSIGYPAVLRTNYTQIEDQADAYFIYDENDIEKAGELLTHGTSVLESWIISEYYLSITAVKSTSGRLQLYPVVKKNYHNEQLISVENFKTKEKELISEIKRVATVIADNISFIGAITVDFIVSPAEALYVGDIYPYPNSSSRYSEIYSVNSVVEAHLRAVTSLPLAEVRKDKEDFMYIPIYAEYKDHISDWIVIYPDWYFKLYPIVKEEQLHMNQEIGYILVRNEEVERAAELLKSL